MQVILKEHKTLICNIVALQFEKKTEQARRVNVVSKIQLSIFGLLNHFIEYRFGLLNYLTNYMFGLLNSLIYF